MSFLDSLKDKLSGHPQDEYFEEDYEEYYDDEGSVSDPHVRRGRSEGSHSGLLGNTPRPEVDSVSVYTRNGRRIEQAPQGYQRPGYSTEGSSATSYMTPSFTPTPSATPIDFAQARVSSGQLPPYVLKPVSYDDVQMVMSRVRTGQPVVLSFKNTNMDIAKRILDFCFGLSCGIDGQVQELADRVFVVLPHGISLTQGDLIKLKSDGVITE